MVVGVDVPTIRLMTVPNNKQYERKSVILGLTEECSRYLYSRDETSSLNFKLRRKK